MDSLRFLIDTIRARRDNHLMETKIESGQRVKMLSSRGVIGMIVVEDLGEVLVVCGPDEYERAQKEDREPVAIGFKRTDLVEIV